MAISIVLFIVFSLFFIARSEAGGGIFGASKPINQARLTTDGLGKFLYFGCYLASPVFFLVYLMYFGLEIIPALGVVLFSFIISHKLLQGLVATDSHLRQGKITFVTISMSLWTFWLVILPYLIISKTIKI